MQEVIEFLNANSMGYLATVEDGQPRLRPWGFMFSENGRFYFCTGNTKDVYKQILTTPYVEFSSLNKEMTWVRLRGKINFTNDVNIKQKILDNQPMVKSIYQTPDNPNFEVFYIEHGTASITNFSGHKEYEF